MNYGVAEAVDPFLEPFAASSSAALFCFCVASVWFGLHWYCATKDTDRRGSGVWQSLLFLAIALLPLVVWVLRGTGVIATQAQIWEVLWLAGWTGMSFAAVVQDVDWTDDAEARGDGWLRWSLAILILLCSVWWFGQSVEFYRNFMLGFNDFGHFLQRVANTAAGRGLLIESPVLPAFWDHFNPGLLLIVPLWKLYPEASLIFALQSVSLSISAWMIFAIALRVGCSRLASTLFGVAWLMQPAVGQMNLAYTYGWHPITFAIPLLLGALWALLSGQRMVALICTLVAMSMEEGVFVIVALVAASCAVLPSVDKFLAGKSRVAGPVQQPDSRYLLERTLPRYVWIVVAIISVMSFLLVYRFSGIAEFQTGRFVALGNSVGEILMSPVLRPSAFWGQVLRWDHIIFIALLWLPCGPAALLKGWRYLLPTLLPLAVLIVWDHRPAHSLAFQYPSILQPMFWFACLAGSTMTTKSEHEEQSNVRTNGGLTSATTAVMTGLILSLFVGQLPFSSPTLREVEATTYGIESQWRRRSTDSDGKWLLAQVAEIRKSGEACLATGRIAAHLVGCSDVETVGQYLERRVKLAELEDRMGDPIRHYVWLVLDRQELFQQTKDQIDAVELEGLQRGFEVVREQYDVVVLRRK